MLATLLIELRRNTRLRIGLGLIVAILLSYASLWLNDYEKQLKNDYQSVISHLNRLQAIASQTQWDRRAAQVHQLRTQLEAQLWRANSKGLAQATFQEWLNTRIKQVQFEGNVRLKVDVAREVSQYPHLWQVTAQLEANFEPKKLNALLLAIAKNPKWIVTERLDIRQTRSHAQFILIVTAYFQGATTS